MPKKPVPDQEAPAEVEASTNGGAPEGEGPSEERPQTNGAGAESE